MADEADGRVEEALQQPRSLDANALHQGQGQGHDDLLLGQILQRNLPEQPLHLVHKMVPQLMGSRPTEPVRTANQ